MFCADRREPRFVLTAFLLRPVVFSRSRAYTLVVSSAIARLALAASAQPQPSVAVVVAAAGGLAATHALAGRLTFLDRLPRSGWLSFAGGLSIAYVFVHLLPELGHHAETFAEGGLVVTFAERHVYLVALVGFAAFYGLEQLVSQCKRDDRPFGLRLPEEGVFWIHVGSFVAYNALVGYLLTDRGSTREVALFALAMALHFVGNDYGLRVHHERAYREIGRWLLAGAVLVGAAVGLFVRIPEMGVAALAAFLAGAVVLNAIKEELPERRESRFWAFVAGAGGYAVVLLLV